MGENKLAVIVEDHEETSEIFVAAVQSVGYRTETYSDGNEALDRLMEEELEVPFLILLDLHLPGIPGDRIFDFILEDERFTDSWVVISSADGSLSKFQQFKRFKNLLILQKPVSFDQLQILTQRLLRR